jgi:ribose transport system substrate-binding protein
VGRHLGKLLFAAAVLLSGCGNRQDAAGGARAAPDVQGVQRAEAFLAPYRAKPSFTPPGEAFDARDCAKGKSMVSIPNNSSNPFLKGIIQRMTVAGGDLGLTVKEWQNQGQPADWAQGIDYAVRTKVDIVDLISGIDPKSIEPQIQRAKAAGVKVMTSHFYDPSQPPNPYLSSSLTVGFGTAGRILADWAVVRTAGAAHILVIQSDEVPPTVPLVEGLRKELAANCPACRIVQQINVGVADWPKKIQPSVQTSLLAHPDINVIIPIYDSMSQFVIPAVSAAGRKGKVLIATFNGTPFVLDGVARGDVDMDVGESVDWIAYATLDGHLRDLCGLKSPAALNVPFYIIDKTNVADAGTPASYDKGYGDAYITGFRKLWKLD